MSLSGEWLIQKKLVGDTKIVFDVGAAIGRTVARYLELFPHATVYAFEPAPANVKRFKERLPGLHGHERVQLIPAAVLDKDGNVPFNLYESPDHHSIFRSTEAFRARKQKPGRIIKTISVPAMTLDTFCYGQKMGRIGVLKIDTEGAERAVLRGARRLLTEGRIRLIYTELLFWSYRIGQSEPWQVMKYLRDYGYYLHSLQAQHHDKNGRLLNADGIFLKNE